MKVFKTGAISLLFLLCVIMSCTAVQAKSSDKVTKVTKSTRYSDNMEYCTIIGKNSNGKTVWKYKCAEHPATELSSVSYKVSKQNVYIIDGDTFIRLHKQTGKRRSKKKEAFPEILGSAAIYVDSSGNLYATGYYGDTVYKVNKKGKQLWASKTAENCFWPDKITSTEKGIKVHYTGEDSQDVVFDAENGEILQ